MSATLFDPEQRRLFVQLKHILRRGHPLSFLQAFRICRRLKKEKLTVMRDGEYIRWVPMKDANFTLYAIADLKLQRLGLIYRILRRIDWI